MKIVRISTEISKKWAMSIGKVWWETNGSFRTLSLPSRSLTEPDLATTTISLLLSLSFYLRLLDLFQFLTSVPNHIDPWFDSSKTRGELAPTLPEVSGVGQGGGGEGGEGVIQLQIRIISKEIFLRRSTNIYQYIWEEYETIYNYLIRKLQK